MKIIIAGSRKFNDFEFDIEIVSGGAKGADKLGERYAKENGFKLKLFPANWKENGKSAGIIRNKDMADYSDRLIAFWDGESKGTEAMIHFMQKLRKPSKVVLFNPNP